MSDTPISDAAVSNTEPHGYQIEQRLSEIESLRARNERISEALYNERILRYATETERNAETERCAKIAREFQLSPGVGRTIAALIMNKGEQTAPVEPEEVYSPHTEII